MSPSRTRRANDEARRLARQLLTLYRRLAVAYALRPEDARGDDARYLQGRLGAVLRTVPDERLLPGEEAEALRSLFTRYDVR